MTYRVSDDVMTAHLEGEAVLLHLGSKRYYRLNETSAAIWNGIERGLDFDALLEDLVQRFDVDLPEARAELARTLDELEAQELITQ
jgi:hypothetical protein